MEHLSGLPTLRSESCTYILRVATAVHVLRSNIFQRLLQIKITSLYTNPPGRNTTLKPKLLNYAFLVSNYLFTKSLLKKIIEIPNSQFNCYLFSLIRHQIMRLAWRSKAKEFQEFRCLFCYILNHFKVIMLK